MGAYSDRVIADGATHYWRLGEPSGTTAADSIAGGANAPGTISGGVTLGQAGPLADGSKAMLFDGTSGKIGTAALTFPTTVTFEAFGKLTVSNADTPILANVMGGAVDRPLWFGLSNGAIILVIDGVVGVTGSVVNDGAWHHLVGVSTATTAWVYVDGVQVGTGAFDRQMSSSHPGWIGWLVNNPSRFWSGALAEVAMYPTALSAPTISAHYALRTATGGGASGPPFPWPLALVLEGLS